MRHFGIFEKRRPQGLRSRYGARRLAVERLEERIVLSHGGFGDFDPEILESARPVTGPPLGIPFSFTVDSQLDAAFPLLRSNLEAAGRILTGLVDGKGQIEVSVVASTDMSFNTAEASSDWAPSIGTDSNGATFQLMEPSTLYEARTGIDINGAKPDIVFEVSSNYLANDSWFDPTGVYRTATVPAGKVDFISTALHELVHGLGMEGFRRTSGSQWGKFINDHQSTFDLLTQWGGVGYLFFNGPRAVSEYGDLVPLTSFGKDSAMAAENYYHLGNKKLIGTDLQDDLMNGVSSSVGARQDVSQLDLAILFDLGWQPATPKPHDLLREPPDLSVLPPIGPIPPIFERGFFDDSTIDQVYTPTGFRPQDDIDWLLDFSDEWLWSTPTGFGLQDDIDWLLDFSDEWLWSTPTQGLAAADDPFGSINALAADRVFDTFFF